MHRKNGVIAPSLLDVYMPTTTNPLVELLPQRANRRPPVMQLTPVDEPSGPLVGFLAIHADRDSCTYKLEEFGADGGRGLCFVKLQEGSDATEAAYCLFVSPTREVTCECKGFTAHQHCRHADAILAALENKWL